MANRFLAALLLALALAACNGAPRPGPRDEEAKPAAPAAADSTAPAESPAPEEPRARGPVLKGAVTDENGAPLAGVRVTLFGGLATRFRGQETVTDAKGEYVFDPLETGAGIGRGDGRYDFYTGMEIEHPTHASADGNNWWDLTVPDEPGRVTRRDFSMVRGGAVAGVVQDGSGAPVQGLGLRLYLEGKGSFFLRYPETDDQGRFTEAGLFPGTYLVDVNEPSLDYPVIGRIEVAAGATHSPALAFTR